MIILKFRVSQFSSLSVRKFVSFNKLVVKIHFVIQVQKSIVSKIRHNIKYESKYYSRGWRWGYVNSVIFKIDFKRSLHVRLIAFKVLTCDDTSFILNFVGNGFR